MSSSGRSIVQHTSYGCVVLTDTDNVEKDYENEQELLDEVKNLRANLIDLICDDEHSDLPMKTYRIHSASEYKTTLPVTIKTRTRLGAIIAFADRDQKQIESNDSLKSLEGMGLWFQLIGERRDDIRKYAESMSDRMTFLVDVEDEIITFSD